MSHSRHDTSWHLKSQMYGRGSVFAQMAHMEHGVGGVWVGVTELWNTSVLCQDKPSDSMSHWHFLQHKNSVYISKFSSAWYKIYWLKYWNVTHSHACFRFCRQLLTNDPVGKSQYFGIYARWLNRPWDTQTHRHTDTQTVQTHKHTVTKIRFYPFILQFLR